MIFNFFKRLERQRYAKRHWCPNCKQDSLRICCSSTGNRCTRGELLILKSCVLKCGYERRIG